MVFGTKLSLPLKVYRQEMCKAKKSPKSLIKMRAFECVENYFRIIGIDLQQSQQKYPFNVKIVLILFIFVCGIISNVVFLFSETQTFQEFNGSLYEISSAFVVATSFSIFTWNMPKLFRFINSLEAIVNKSNLWEKKEEDWVIIRVDVNSWFLRRNVQTGIETHLHQNKSESL